MKNQNANCTPSGYSKLGNLGYRSKKSSEVKRIKITDAIKEASPKWLKKILWSEQGKAESFEYLPKGGRRGTWRLPCFNSKANRMRWPSEIKRVEKANKYLRYMENKLENLSREGNTEAAGVLGDILLRRSKAFRAYIYHEANEGWYHNLPWGVIRKNITEMTKMLRLKKHMLDFTRHYIPKPNGKLRPIGSPNGVSKAFLFGIERIVRKMYKRHIGDYQHGFMDHVGCADITKKLINGLRKNRKVFCFDLRKCFNMIEVQGVCDYIEERSPGWGEWIKAFTWYTVPKTEEIKEEGELVDLGGNLIYRSGFTQGSPLSPILSNLGIELSGIGKTPGLQMYADDGIVLRETDEQHPFEGKIDENKLRMYGVEFSKEKEYGWKDRFKFLGLEYDTVKGIIKTKDGEEVNYHGASTSEIDRVSQYGEYSNSGKYSIPNWYWVPVKDSPVEERTREFPNICREELTRISEVFLTKDVWVIKGSNSTGFMWHILDRQLNVLGKYNPMMESTMAISKLLMFLDESESRGRNIAMSHYLGGVRSSKPMDIFSEGGRAYIRMIPDRFEVRDRILRGDIPPESLLKNIDIGGPGLRLGIASRAWANKKGQIRGVDSVEFMEGIGSDKLYLIELSRNADLNEKAYNLLVNEYNRQMYNYFNSIGGFRKGSFK